MPVTSKCSTCKIDGPFRGGYCGPCRRLYNKTYYEKNVDRLAAKHHAFSSGITSGNREFINSIKVNPCSDCGVRYQPWIMHFDHVRGLKFKNIAKMMHMEREILRAEIAKCELVCANCHADRTFKRHKRKYN